MYRHLLKVHKTINIIQPNQLTEPGTPWYNINVHKMKRLAEMTKKHINSKTKFSRRTFLKLAAGTFAAATLIDMTSFEPQHIEVTRHNVPMKYLPDELDGLTIVQLSDLHRSRIVPDRLIQSAVDITNKLSPDIVVLTGDFVSSNPRDAAPCARILSGLSSRYGSYAVLGNHDHWADATTVRNCLKDHGIKVLHNANLQPVPGLTLLGLDDYWAGNPDFVRTWKGADANSAQVFLSHNPLALKCLKEEECLMITGHTHGGQVNIPFIPRNRLPGLKGWKYIQGWCYKGNVQMYVNRGIGMINPPIRFMCSPEITLFTLRKATAPHP